VCIRSLSTILFCLACAVSSAEDYTFLWWADGWRGRAAEWHKTLNIQTDCYGAAVDVEKPALLHLGRIADPKPYAQAVAESNDAVNALTPADLRLSVVVGGIEYRCVGAAGCYEDEANFPVRIIESGRLVQRADILNVTLKSDQGQVLDGDGRVELVAGPRQLHLLLEFAPKSELRDVDVVVALTQEGKRVDGKRHFERMAAGERGVAGLVWPRMHQGLLMMT